MPERDRWIVEISTAPGQRKKFYCKTKQEAVRKKSEVLRELEKGTLASGPQRKLKDYLEDWLENVHKDNIRISSYVKYKKLIRYIAADLGEVWLQKLTPEQVQRFYTKKRKDGLSSKTVHEIHGVLHLALKHAVRWNYVSRNVCGSPSFRGKGEEKLSSSRNKEGKGSEPVTNKMKRTCFVPKRCSTVSSRLPPVPHFTGPRGT